MITKTITLSSEDWLHISSSETKDDNGFIFWANENLLFSSVSQPWATDQIPLTKDVLYGFAKQQDFYIKWAINTEVYLTPFDWAVAVWWGWGGSVNSVTWNIVDNTDPANPVVNAKITNLFTWDISDIDAWFYHDNNLANIQWPIHVMMRGDTDFTGGTVFSIPAWLYTNMSSITFIWDKTKLDPAFPIYGSALFTQQWVVFDAMPNFDWVILACLDTVCTNATAEFKLYAKDSTLITMDATQWGTGEPAIVLSNDNNDVMVVSENTNMMNQFWVPFIENRSMARINHIMMWTSQLDNDAITANGTWPGTVGDLYISVVDSWVDCGDQTAYNNDGTLTVKLIEKSNQIDFTAFVSSLTSRNVRDAIEELWGMIGSWSGVSKSSEILINQSGTDVIWKQYALVSDANTYLESIPATTPRAIGLAWIYASDIEAIDYGDIFGDWSSNTILGNVSLKTATVVQNNFYDCQIGKLTMKDISSGAVAITNSTEVTQAFVPATSTYSTDWITPTSGTYWFAVDWNMPTIMQRSDTAADIENYIHTLWTQYDLVTVAGNIADWFVITRNWIASDWSSITATNIDLNPFPTSTYATYSGQPHPTMTAILITANNAWSVWNCLITSTGANTVNQKITMWNIANPTQAVTLTSWDWTQDRPSSQAGLKWGTDWWFLVSDKAGTTEQQTLTFSGVPASGQWMLSYLYNSVTYYSSILAFDADYTAVETAIRDIFQQILVAEGVDLWATKVKVTWDYSTWFVFELSKYPWEAEELISVATSTTATYATYAGTLAGTSNPILVTADNIWSVWNVTPQTYNGIQTIQDGIDTWNTNNPGNTVTLTSGDGTQIPSNKTKLTLTGGNDAYTYNLEWGGSSAGQIAYLQDVKLKDFAVTGKNSTLSMKGWSIDWGNFSGVKTLNIYDININWWTFESWTIYWWIINFNHFGLSGDYLYVIWTALIWEYILTKTLTLKNTIDWIIIINPGATLNTYECTNLTVINNGGTWNDYSKNIIVSGDPIAWLITPLQLVNGYPQVCYDTVWHHMYRATGLNPWDRILI